MCSRETENHLRWLSDQVLSGRGQYLLQTRHWRAKVKCSPEGDIPPISTAAAVKGLPLLLKEVRACTICAAHLPHGPRPVLQVDARARILIAGQASKLVEDHPCR